MTRKIILSSLYPLIPLSLILLVSVNPPALAQAPFYQGKTVTIVAGSAAGVVYDFYARLLAEYLVKYIPGNPNIIVQNMPGAGSLIAANYIYGVAKPDGLTIGSIFPALYFDQLVGRKEVKFDWAKFAWIGNPAKVNHFLYMRADTPYKTIEDIRNAKEPPKCGATGTASTAYYIPKLMEEILGTKFNIVAGYLSGSDIDLAVERGEVQCRAFTIDAYLAREPFHTWRNKKFVRELIQDARKRDERMPDVPTIYEFMDRYKTPESGRRLATVILAAGEVGRPYVAPPGMAAERVNIFREAFMKTLKDPGFLAEAKKKRLEIRPSSGEELEALAKEVMAQPPEIIERMKKVLGQ
ncbi:MAG: Bug family tripartite tricarboxylate transporter substrate binding protein [Candidatus Binatia bacterium]